MWIKIQQMQHYADIYLLQSYSNTFRVSQHPSSGVLKTVPAASGTGHTTCTATPLQRGPDQTTLEGSSGTSSMTCTGGCGYSF